MRAAELTAEFGIAGVLDFVATQHGLVKAAISLDGVAGELYLQGAHLTAWQPPGERPVLFTSPNSAFAPGRAIRGGIPIIFPWFGANRHAPAAPQHGFARTTTWHLDSVETAGHESLTLTLGLGDGDVASPFWPEPFRAIYTVVFAQTLSLRLAVQNRATHPITFEEALQYMGTAVPRTPAADSSTRTARSASASRANCWRICGGSAASVPPGVPARHRLVDLKLSG
jgi:glucose-6-phosphate 1-epimerase